ncbi:unnamed protein product, partial [marine sediment metagenome]
MNNIDLPELELEDWKPMEPAKGPPLPKFLNIFWPWYTPPTPPPGKANLYGRVTDAETGLALVGVLVTLDGMQTST